ncbi:MAG: ComEC family competence protein [Flavobacteriaceae bacterium]|nr:ComEC family competence protein [Flavobacteriaceae bacterium]
MRLVNITAFKITLCYLAGILCSHFFEIGLNHIQIAGILISFLLLIAWFRARKMIFQDGVFGGLAFFSLFIFGAWVYQLHQPFNHKDHYINETFIAERNSFLLKIKSQLKPDLYNEKYTASILAIDEKDVRGDVLLLIPKDTLDFQLAVDDLIFFTTQFQELPTPKNPYQFDYAAYLNQLGIYHQLRINKDEILLKKKGKTTLKGMAFELRKHINTRLTDNGFSGNPLALINALLLGQRQELSQEVYSDFAAAGAVHILAVSGLHVGIIMLILQFVFKPLERLRSGKTIKICCVVICLWMFAVIAGLSPSVLRAVTMFSFLAYAMESNRETSTFNTLLASAFLLLTLNPNLLFHIGFQMSYLAVFAIIWINPMLQKHYHPKTIVDRKLWEIFTVSCSAQLGVSFLSIYYFNHFPGLFFVTNLVVLPFLGLILGFGILVILLATFKALPQFMIDGYTALLDGLVYFINWAASQKSFYFDGLTFTKLQVVLLYLIIITLILVLQKFSGRRVVYVLSAVICLQVVFIWNKRKAAHQEFVVFHKSRNSIFGIKNGNQLNLFSNLDAEQMNKETLIKNYKTKSKIKHNATKSVLETFRYKHKTIVVIDSLSVYPSVQDGVDLVILRNSPRVHLERMIDSLKPKRIIADGSNYTTYVNRWRETAQKRKLPFHHTGKEGAFVLD